MNKYGLLGHHLTHSFSAIIHNELFRQNMLDATYEIIDIEEDEIIEKLKLLKAGVYTGFNVTIPYKQTVMNYLDELSDAAKAIGACNTIYCRNGKLVGDNTDYYGFILQLQRQKVDVKNQKVYVMGNGGAAKAVVYALKQLGANVTVVSRKVDSFTYHDLKQLSAIDILINTTPVGMFPNTNESVVSKEVISKAKTCVDIIYNPKQTQFLKLANQINNGLPMLIYQAIRAQEIWHEKAIDYDYELIANLCERKLD